MQVNVVLFGMLRERLAKESRGRLSVELPDGASIASLLDALSINVPVLCSLNGQMERDFQRSLSNGDEVHIFQPVGGG